MLCQWDQAVVRKGIAKSDSDTIAPTQTQIASRTVMTLQMPVTS